MSEENGKNEDEKVKEDRKLILIIASVVFSAGLTFGAYFGRILSDIKYTGDQVNQLISEKNQAVEIEELKKKLQGQESKVAKELNKKMLEERSKATKEIQKCNEKLLKKDGQIDMLKEGNFTYFNKIGKDAS